MVDQRLEAECGDFPAKDLPHRVLDSLLEGCQVVGPDYRYLYVNGAVVRQAKTTREGLLGRTMMECFPGIEKTPMFSRVQRCLTTKCPDTMENEFSFPDGTKEWFELRFEPVPEGVVILSVDITERKRAEFALRRTMRALSTLSRCNQKLVRVQDESQFRQDVCDLVVESGGYSSAYLEIHAPTDGGDYVMSTVAERKLSGFPSDSKQHCRSFDVRVHGAAIGSLRICALEDDAFDENESALLEEIALDLGFGIETLRGREAHDKLEEQLVASQRLEAVGRLAGGVAHDFNNLLTVILNCSDLALEQMHEFDPLRANIEEVRDAGERAAALTRQLLAFSRKQVLEPQVINLNEVISPIESMLRRLLGEDITISAHLTKTLGNVVADAGQMEQVLMNLAVNARDAMPDGGNLIIETANAELDERFGEEHVSAKPGRYVRLSITDTGTGMDAETRCRVFEPFFTTKEKGKGTGLGLAMVYGVIKQSGGNIWVYSERDRGTTVEIHLPRTDAAVTERTDRTSTMPACGNEVILVVEDDSAVSKITERILTSRGYRVHSTSDGREALRLCQKLEGHVDLLLTDVVLPEMSGRELAERIQQSQPTLKILYTSGYADDTVAHHGILDPYMQFISKPFSTHELTRKVRDILDEPLEDE